MLVKASTLKYIRVISSLAIIATVLAGFISPISEFQALVVTPLFLLLQMCLFGYADFMLDELKQSTSENAEIHHLPLCKIRNKPLDKKRLKAA